MFTPDKNPFQFQEDNVDEIYNTLFSDNEHNCVLYQLPTGGGKTMVGGEVIRRTLEAGHNALFITHRASILDQTYKMFAEGGIDVGKVVAGGSWMKHKPLNIGMEKTFINRMKGNEHAMPKLLVIDEAHHVVGGDKPNQMGKIVKTALQKGSRVLKLTATPARLDGSGLGMGFGGFATKMIKGPHARKLIELGRIMEPIIMGVPEDELPDMTGAKTTAGDYTAGAVEKALDEAFVYGNAVRHFQDVRDDYGAGPSVVFCRSEKSANESAEEFRIAGFRVAVLTQKSAKSEIERVGIVSELERGGIDIMISVDIVSEGFDLPEIMTGIMERPTQSLTVFAQQLGRLLRVSPGKEHAVLLDTVGNCWRHQEFIAQEFYGNGFPWSLVGNPSKGKGSRETEDDGALNFSLKQCVNTKCTIYSPQYLKVCECGAGFPKRFRREPKRIDGKLALLDFSELQSREARELREMSEEMVKKKRDKELKDYHRLAKLTGRTAAQAYNMYLNGKGRR